MIIIISNYTYNVDGKLHVVFKRWLYTVLGKSAEWMNLNGLDSSSQKSLVA